MAEIDFIKAFVHIGLALALVGLPLGIILDDWVIEPWQERRKKPRPCRKVRDVRRAAADARLATYRKRLGPEEAHNG